MRDTFITSSNPPMSSVTTYALISESLSTSFAASPGAVAGWGLGTDWRAVSHPESNVLAGENRTFEGFC
ncbi:MAG TPA: hypothetical protein PKM59_04470 [Thermodesulfobacteriota bacterium]|nr:hypothetical protein [Thermodesulfobacteriota bacterium]